MGSSGGKGNSRANTSSSATTSQTTTNNIDNRVFQSDQGALDVARDIALESVEAGSSNLRDTLSVVRDANEATLDFSRDALGASITGSRDALESSFDFSGDAVRDALGFAGDAVRDSLSFSDRSSERQSSAFDRAFDFGRELFAESLDTVTGVLEEGQAQLGNTVTNLNAIARQQSTSEAERIQDIASQALKIGAVMVGLIALAIVVSRMRTT